MDNMERFSIVADELQPGDVILLPRAIVRDTTLSDTRVVVHTDKGYPVSYKRGAPVTVNRAVA